jgi:hypothetical protein
VVGVHDAGLDDAVGGGVLPGGGLGAGGSRGVLLGRRIGRDGGGGRFHGSEGLGFGEEKSGGGWAALAAAAIPLALL